MKRKKRKLKKINITKLFLFLFFILLIGFMLRNKDGVNIKNNIFENGKYYIKDNYNRYKDYKNKNEQLEVDEVIKCVNSNVDYEFYTNIKDTDITKKELMLVNKYNNLKENYVPDLVEMSIIYSVPNQYMDKEAYKYFKNMVNDALKEDISIYNISAYRSYETQNRLYSEYLVESGLESTDIKSARPGHSEHQTGLAVDINVANSNANFEKTKEYAWLIKNAYKYGFILRYPEGKTYITGYKFEPWHYRFVGIEAALYIYENDITFEEYYAVYVK